MLGDSYIVRQEDNLKICYTASSNKLSLSVSRLQNVIQKMYGIPSKEVNTEPVFDLWTLLQHNKQVFYKIHDKNTYSPK